MRRPSKKSLAAILAAGVAVAGDHTLHTAYQGEVLRIIDSDTQEVRLTLLAAMGMTLDVHVRALGIDTPEKSRRYTSKCSDDGAAEIAFAKQATAWVASVIPPGAKVRVTDVGLGKYAGRTLGNLLYEDAEGEWRSLSAELIDRGYAVEYWGKTKKSWCKTLDDR